MNREEFINKCNDKLRIVRAEYEISQEKMAWLLGLSKKTIVEIEKGRSSLGWSGAVTFSTIFADSEILASTFGDRPEELINLIAFEGFPTRLPKTMGGKLWWKELESLNGFKIQQNLVSGHFRILNPENRLICSSFNLEEIKMRLKEVADDPKFVSAYESRLQSE